MSLRSTTMSRSSSSNSIRSEFVPVSDAGRSTSTKYHPYFWFRDGNFVFLVGNCFFKVHRYFFERDSCVFGDMFRLPVPLGEQAEGETEEKPIRLDGISLLDFERFLKVLYPSQFGIDDLTSPEEWASVVDFATKYEFESIRALAIRKLSEIGSSIDKIVLGHRLNVPQWLVPAYTDICHRAGPLTLEEGHRLGMEDVILIAKTREKTMPGGRHNYYHADIREYFRSRLTADDWGQQHEGQPVEDDENLEYCEYGGGVD